MKRNAKIDNDVYDYCFNISNSLLSVLNENFSGEFISLNDLLRNNGKFNGSFFYNFDDNDNLSDFNLSLDCGYVDDDGDKCSDKISISLNRDGGVVCFNRFCLYNNDIPINQINEAHIIRKDNSIIISYSKSVNNGFDDYEDTYKYVVDAFEIEDCQTNNMFRVFARPINKNKILKQL